MAKHSKDTKEKKSKKGGGGLQALMTPSPELAAVIGSKDRPRGKVTKKLWAYIKEHDLQNPKNRREIVPDKKLKKVFGTSKPVNMFKMTKLVNEHLTKAE